MTNVAKHSGANRCRVALVFDQMLELTVADNGRGNGQPTGNGVGWTSMTERAAELGGTCTISDGVHGGLLVRALLPLHAGRGQRGPRVIHILVADDHPAFGEGSS